MTCRPCCFASFPGRLVVQALIALLLCGMTWDATADDEKPANIKPEQARKFVGKKCVVTFEVKKTKHSPKRKLFYLDSEEDFHDAKNIGIQIEEPMAQRVRERKKIEDLVADLKGRTVRVTGEVFLQDDLPYIKLADPDDLEVLEKKKEESKK
jgi:hypothetical protein